MRISASIDINQRPEDIFPWIANPDKARLWQKNVKGGRVTKKTNEVVGTTFQETVEEGGKTLDMKGEITKYQENKLMAFHLESKMHVVDVNYTIEESGGISKFAMDADIRWKPPMNIISLFIGKKIRNSIKRQIESELTELKKLCEKNPEG